MYPVWRERLDTQAIYMFHFHYSMFVLDVYDVMDDMPLI